jgi:hypothetical protein
MYMILLIEGYYQTFGMILKMNGRILDIPFTLFLKKKIITIE